MGVFKDILGTTKTVFQIALNGVKLKNNGGNLSVRNAADNADAEVTASKVNVSGDDIVLNSDAAESGADWTYTLERPSTGMTANVKLKLPPTKGTAGQVLGTDGNDPTQLDWISAASTLDSVHINDTTINFGDSSPVALMTLPGSATFLKAEVIIDTPFNGTAPTLAIGILGATSKYMTTTDNNLKGNAKDRYQVEPGEAIDGSPENLIATFNSDGSSAGSCRVLIYYSTPS